MIPSGYTELKTAYQSHVKIAATGSEKSHYLLLFYGLECGLKSIYLRRNSLLRTDRINDANLRKTHDLFSFIKNLRLPAQIAGPASPPFRLERDSTALPTRDAHECWRYGIMIETNDETRLIGWMNAIQAWIKENI